MTATNHREFKVIFLDDLGESRTRAYKAESAEAAGSAAWPHAVIWANAHYKGPRNTKVLLCVEVYNSDDEPEYVIAVAIWLLPI